MTNGQYCYIHCLYATANGVHVPVYNHRDNESINRWCPFFMLEYEMKISHAECHYTPLKLQIIGHSLLYVELGKKNAAAG